MTTMKKNHLNKILVPLVFGIWGWVIWTYLGASLFTEENDTREQSSVSLVSAQDLGTDTFTLKLNYRDPFLNKAQRRTSSSPSLIASSPLPQSQPNIQRIGRNQSPPPLRYKGNIQGPADAPIQTGIIEWQGQTLTVSVQDSMNGLKVLAFTPTHIKVAYADTIWIISK